MSISLVVNIMFNQDNIIILEGKWRLKDRFKLFSNTAKPGDMLSKHRERNAIITYKV